jgi:hypothetical protein
MRITAGFLQRWRSERPNDASAAFDSSCVHVRHGHLPPLENMKENNVLARKLVSCSLAALAGAAMLTFSMAPASAFTLASPSLEQSYASGQIEKVWWHHRHCWRGRWGHLHCGW